jgi:hypothetical protein
MAEKNGMMEAVDFGFKLGLSVATFTATNFFLKPLLTGADLLTKKKGN